MTAATPNPTFVVGILHELPTGQIARAYGSNKDGVSYYFDDDKGGRTATHEETKSWKPRNDLNDFPNARDPRLPYIFDLHWDIKHRSELVQALKDGHDDQGDILKAIVKHQVDLGKIPASLTAQIERTRAETSPMPDARYEAIGQAIAKSHLATFKELQAVVEKDDPKAFSDMVAFKAPFLTGMVVDKHELNKLVDKLESSLATVSKIDPSTERARQALDFLDTTGKKPALKA